VAGGTWLVGILFGFIFAIPRGGRSETPTLASSTTPFQRNTNLVDISDWLTKILVGVTLVQFKDILGFLVQLAQALGPVVYGGGSAMTGKGATIAVIAYFATCGFLLGYLYTQLMLVDEFENRRVAESPEYFDGMMNALLYRPAPDGFTKALEFGRIFKSKFKDVSNYRVSMWLACAHAQAYQWAATSRPPNAEKMKEHREGALGALTDALRENPDSSDFLRVMWKKPAPRTENDLDVFADDPEFKAVLDPPPPPPRT